MTGAPCAPAVPRTAPAAHPGPGAPPRRTDDVPPRRTVRPGAAPKPRPDRPAPVGAAGPDPFHPVPQSFRTEERPS